MLLYFSGEKNSHIFNKICSEFDVGISLEETNCISDYLKKNMNSLGHIKYLAIDLEHLIDTEEEMLSTLSALRLCRSKIDIIIVALNKEKGDMFLAKLFAEGIYNFITARDDFEMQNEIKYCVDKKLNNNYASAIAYKVENIKEIAEKKENILNNVFSNLKNKFKSKDKTQKKDNFIKTKKLKNLKTKIENTEQLEQIERLEQTDGLEVEQVNEINQTNTEKQKGLPKDDILFVENSEVIQISESLEDKIKSIFYKKNDNRFYQEKQRKKMEIEKLKDDIFLFYYYQKPVGILYKNNCIVDSIYKKEDISKFFKAENINLNFEDGILKKIKEIQINAN